MKKLFAILLAIAMAATMSLPTFAATDLTTSPATGKDAGDYSIDISGTYVAGANAKEVISADIAWDAMDFTYDQGKGEYSVTDHKTTYPNAKWSDNKAGITVTNHSNVAIDASMSFSSTASGVTGTFYTKSGNGETATYTESTANKLSLASGEDKSTEGETYTTPTGTLYFGISGDPITEDKALGTITVTIAKGTGSESGTTETWTTVTDETTLEAALEAGGKIKLGDNITAGSISLSSTDTAATSATLDLNGKTLTVNAVTIGKYYTLTVTDSSSSKDGKLVNASTSTAVDLITVNGGTLNVQGGAISSTLQDSAINLDSGSADISGGTVVGERYGIYAVKSTTLTISGGEVSGYSAIYSKGNTTISGGTLKASYCGVYQKSGELNISNVTIDVPSNSASETTYISVWLDDDGEATITGGIFGASQKMNLKVESGKLTISGGTFSVDPSSYVAEGYTATESNGTYTVTANAD